MNNFLVILSEAMNLLRASVPTLALESFRVPIPLRLCVSLYSAFVKST